MLHSHPAVTHLTMEPLHITSLDFLLSLNGPVHRTNKYATVRKGIDVILRRGQPFIIQLHVQGRDFDADIDLVRLTFSFGPDAKTTKNTKGAVTAEVGPISKTKEWACRIHEEHHGNFQVKVISPPDIPVGLWLCEVEVGLIKKKTTNATKLAKPIYLLFNPWCKDDSVYMPEEDLLDEYVLNDVGKIWVGAYGSCRGREWVFGQFDKHALAACLLILERAGLHPTVRGNPVRVSRAISKLVNANDDRGVVVGKWRVPYTDGTPPAAWTGSTEILKKFLLTGREVGYGQCWVFAGVLATVCRALGLPSRVVSNLVSAHDANSSLTIDRYYDENLKAISPEDMAEDSIWNFHVWNDVWMARPDLPPGYGGWQAVDATPQETSDGFFQCGPASVRAIKAGEISHLYDGAFVYASVNADIIRWKEDTSTEFGFIKIQAIKDEIGKMILTKKPFLFDVNGDQDKEEITEQYKHAEGTTNERLVVYNAVGQNEEAKRYYDMPNKHESDVKFKLLALERIMIGENYEITMEMKNTGKEPRSVKALLSSTSVFYTGIAAHDVKSVSAQRILSPGSKEELSTTVTAAEYLQYLVEYGIMKISALCTVTETNQTWADEDDFQVLKPAINIKVLDKARVKDSCRISFSFVNPLSLPLSNGYFTFEVPGLTKSRTINIGEVGPLAEAATVYPIIPKVKGKFKLVASFFSKQLYDITGSVELHVKKHGLF